MGKPRFLAGRITLPYGSEKNTVTVVRHCITGVQLECALEFFLRSDPVLHVTMQDESQGRVSFGEEIVERDRLSRCFDRQLFRISGAATPANRLNAVVFG